MLQLRIEGEVDETDTLIEALRAAGVEVQVGTRKKRREGFTHTYAVARLAPAVDEPAPVRVPASVPRRRRQLPR